jgi:hypothetical protein
MRLRHLRLLRFSVVLGASACGSSSTLDLGHSAPPFYATPETIAVGDNAPAGVPTVIASHQDGAYAVTVDDSRVYWTTAGRVAHSMPSGCVVRSCIKNDCAATLTTYGPMNFMACAQRSEQLLVNRTHVFWSSAFDTAPQQIYSCPIEGCPEGEPVRLVKTGDLRFAVDDDYLYWQSIDATIWRCPPENCAEKTSLIAFRDSILQRGHDSLVVDAARIYWFDTEGLSNVIKTTAKDGTGMARTLATNVISPAHLVVDANNVYWMEAPDGMAVKTCPLTGCPEEPTVVVSQSRPVGSSTGKQSAPFGGLSVDEDQIFWRLQFVSPGGPTPEGMDSVRACSKHDCGTNSTALVERQTRIEQLAVDATHVYWTSVAPMGDHNGGYLDTTVQRIRRRP